MRLFNRFAHNSILNAFRYPLIFSKLNKSFNSATLSPFGNLEHVNTYFNAPVNIFDIRRKSPYFCQLIVRSFSTTAQINNNVHIEGSGKPKHPNEEEPRWFHRSPTESKENPAYTYLKNHPEYEKMFFQHEIYKRLITEDGRLTAEGEKNVNLAVKAFIDLCNTNPDEPITDPKYEAIFADLISQSSILTDVELLLFYFNLRRFPKKPKAKDKDYKKIWQPLDDLCLNRLSERKWNLEYMFNLADLIYSADLATESKFHWDLVKRLYRRVDHLSKEEFIRMMFCFGGVKSLPDTLSIYNIEYNLPKFIDELTPEEVAVVSVGFLRTKTIVNNGDVLKKMLEIVADDAKRIPSPSVSAVAKAATLSARNCGGDVAHKFLDSFVSEVPRIDFHACASLVLLAMKCKVIHEELLREIVKRLEGNVSITRSKDLDYICSGLTTFNIDCPKLYQEIIEDFQKRIMTIPMKTFCNIHGRSLINILHHLSMRNIYPQELISLALSDDFLGRTFGRSMYTYSQEVLYLDICTGLEIENYNGPRLSEKFRGFLTKKNMLWIAEEEKVSSSVYQTIARFMLEVCINSLGGPDFCHLCNVVPPFRTIGTVYCLNQTNQQPLPVPESFVSIDDFNIKYIPDSQKDNSNNLEFHAIVLFPGNQYISNAGKPNGIAVMHCRQMEKMGFKVHPVYLGHTVTSPTEMKEVVSKILGKPVPDEPKVE